MPASSDLYLNPKQELFCKFYAEGETQIRAYELAGYTPSSSNANNLAQRPAIQKRVKELRIEHERREMEFAVLKEQATTGTAIEKGVDWTFNRIMDLMAENLRCAQIAGEYKAANECLKMMADSMGMLNKAKADADADQRNKAGAKGTLALVGEVVDFLADAGGRGDPEEHNPLAPRLPSA